MISNEEVPIGFTMELAQHSDILAHFSQLPEQERQSIISRARNAQSREEMLNLVESIFK